MDMWVVAQDGLQYQHIVATPDGSLQCWEDCQWPLSDEGGKSDRQRKVTVILGYTTAC